MSILTPVVKTTISAERIFCEEFNNHKQSDYLGGLLGKSVSVHLLNKPPKHQSAFRKVQAKRMRRIIPVKYIKIL